VYGIKAFIPMSFSILFCFLHLTDAVHRTPPRGDGNYAERREELRANLEYYNRYLEGKKKWEE